MQDCLEHKKLQKEIIDERNAAKANKLLEGDIVGFYEENGNIVLRKMK